MREALRVYYERELSYLRQAGVEFAAKYPKIASRLSLGPDGSQDPHVERLLEGVSLLTARVRRKLDDELPEITDSLLGILYPYYLAPIPSMAIVQFQLDEGQGQLTGGYEIPRHTVVTAKPVQGMRCRFRTGYPTMLWPVQVVDATLERQLSVNPAGAPRAFRARSLVRLRLRTLAGATFGALKVRSLRFYLHGETALAMGLYEMLCGGPCQLEMHLPRGGKPPVVLPGSMIRPVGFGPDEVLCPYPRHSFRGYGLLDEYFTFPEKFLFVDVDGFEHAAALGAAEELELRIFSARAARFDQEVRPEAFRLGCTPIVNLFAKPAEPIWLDHTKVEYRVVPDVHHPDAHEVYSVDAVTSTGDESSSQREFRPLYALRHGSDPDAPNAYWHTVRDEALDGATEVHVSLVDASLRPTSPAAETLSLQLTCTNRDLPAQIRFTGTPGGDFDSEQVPPFARIQCLRTPTPPRRRDPGRGAHWHLISHLALNYLSLVEHGREGLLGILELYDPTGSPTTRRQIEGIRDVRCARAVRNVNGAVCRGLRVTIDFDPEHFVGTSPYLLAAVLDRFLGLYASINSFSQLVARVPPDEEPLQTWPARAGELTLL